MEPPDTPKPKPVLLPSSSLATTRAGSLSESMTTSDDYYANSTANSSASLRTSSSTLVTTLSRGSSAGSNQASFPSSSSSQLELNPYSLPIPTSSLMAATASSNRSQVSFSLSDILDPSAPFPSEIGSPDICVAPDGSFVETSSGPAARELKRRYDTKLGVGKDIRSPYAITAFVNQHGKSMYRVGHRELLAPGALVADATLSLASSSTISSINSDGTSRTKRRSRMSMNTFLPPTFLKHSPRPNTTIASRKVPRKTRSIPDMFGGAVSPKSPGMNFNPAPGGEGSNSNLPLPTPPARPHSKSMTGADLPRLASVPRTTDMFAEAMGWSLLLRPTSALFRPNVPPKIPNPFGVGMVFDSPSLRPGYSEEPPGYLLPAPRHLREVQSFESGLTARQDSHPSPQVTINEHDTNITEFSTFTSSTSRSTSPVVPPTPVPKISPSQATLLHSRYATDVFDVLQTFRGLPQLDRFDPVADQDTFIKLSLKEDSAAPRDDPRFVVWGIVAPAPPCQRSSSQNSRPSSAKSSRRNTRAGPDPIPDSSLAPPQRVLAAATIERWLAQLTSVLDYDELLTFFLTYRTYIGSIDLAHLLICRFHWTLQGAVDDTARRIVRVRTFVAMRFWLLTFFVVDFVPNRELRVMVAEWLNDLVKDPVLKQHADGLIIVKKLRKAAKDCKQAHSRAEPTTSFGSVGSTSSAAKVRSSSIPPKKPKSHVLGQKFAEAVGTNDDEDSDVDLDFLPENLSQGAKGRVGGDGANAHLSAALVGAGLSPTRPAALPLAALALRPPSSSIVSGNEGPGESSPNFMPSSAALPIHHSAISRAFVATMGRLGRWKRVLHARSTAAGRVGGVGNQGGDWGKDVSAFDLEERDSAVCAEGVKQYSKEMRAGVEEPRRAAGVIVCSPDYASSLAAEVELGGEEIVADSADTEVVADSGVSIRSVSSTGSLGEPLGGTDRTFSSGLRVDVDFNQSATPPEEDEAPTPSSQMGLAAPGPSNVSIRSVSSTGSLGEIIQSSKGRSPWQFDVVSIDDLDLSDTSSDAGGGFVNGGAAALPMPPGLRRPPRRLPLRKDFEFVRRSESISSLGLASSRLSAVSRASSVMSSGDSLGFGGAIHQWQMNALVDSLSVDEEHGDVEAALRRLEGQINPEKQQEKSTKVDGWVKQIRERMAAGDYGDEQPRMLSDDEGEGEDDLEGSGESDENDMDGVSLKWSGDEDDERGEPQTLDQAVASLQSSSQASGPAAPRALASTIPVPRPVTSPVRGGSSDSSKPYRSFVLGLRAETLAQHFAMIDRELFMGVKFEELVLDDWRSCAEVDVLDWGTFLKDRARWRAEGSNPQKTSALAAVRARFNLVVNFTVAEVVLTQPGDRASLVGKFIRIAWKSYMLSSFATLMAIITGLQSDWVQRAMRRLWGRVGLWETRMLNDFKTWTTREADFKFLRRAVDAMIDSKPLGESESHSASVSGSVESKSRPPSDKQTIPTACVPFIGVYLSQLRQHSQLPDLIDPTAPNVPVGIDPATGNFESPAHPNTFSSLAPLPPSMQLEPLINVHKQRLIARVIQSLVAGQHLATRVHFAVDKRVFQRCLKIRGLNVEGLQRASYVYPE